MSQSWSLSSRSRWRCLLQTSLLTTAILCFYSEMWWSTSTTPSGSVIYRDLTQTALRGNSVIAMSVYKSEIDVAEQASAEQKIKSMVECKDFRKGIIQLQWGHKKMKMQMEDLNNKIRDIRLLKLTEEQRDVSAISFL